MIRKGDTVKLKWKPSIITGIFGEGIVISSYWREEYAWVYWPEIDRRKRSPFGSLSKVEGKL